MSVQGRDTFDLLVDERAMSAFFQQVPGLQKTSLRHCRIMRTRYRNYTSPKQQHKAYLSVAYEFELKASGRTLKQIVLVRACRAGRSYQEYLAALEQPLRQPAVGNALVHLPDDDLTIWAFPNDPQLPQLGILMGDAALMHFPFAALGIKPEAEAVHALNTQVLHYYPEERCTARYDLSLGAARTISLVGKTFSSNRGQRIFENMIRLNAVNQTVRLAKPIAYDPKLNTLWQKTLPGQPLDQELNAKNAPLLLAQAARTIAFLHSVSIAAGRHWGSAEHLREIVAKSKKLSHAYPTIRPLIAQLETLFKRIDASPGTSCRTIHGDCSPQQFLLDGETLTLLDFDELATGNPAQDLAAFLLNLYFNHDAAMMPIFFEAYVVAVDWSIPEKDLSWYGALSLFTRAYRLYRQNQPAALPQINDLMLLAKHCLQTGLTPLQLAGEK